MKRKIKTIIIILSLITILIGAYSILHRDNKKVVDATIIKYKVVDIDKYIVYCKLKDGNIYSFYSDSEYKTDKIILIIKNNEVINAIA